MATIKSYTDISQSKRLAKILPLDSADMCWQKIYDENHLLSDYKIELLPFRLYSGLGVPAWSLSALLDALPQSISKYIESESCRKTFHLNLFRSHYYCVSYCFEPSVDDNNLYCVGENNWVDACYKMILKLYELKML